MFFYLAQQGLIILTNWILSFPDVDENIISIITNFPSTITPFLNAIHGISFFFPVNDLLLYIKVFIALEAVLYTTAFATWLVRIATVGVIK